MKNKNIILFVVSIVVIITYFIIPSYKQKEEVINTKKEITINVLTKDNEIKSLNLEEYLIGVVAAEMPASFNDEALKAQVIASRTYALYKIEHSNQDYDVTTDVTTQSYIDETEMLTKWGEDYQLYYNKIKKAVEETNNLVLLQDNEIICSYYFAMSNGYTEDSINVFNQDLSYIEPVESSWEINLNKYEVTTNFTKEEFCTLLSIDCITIEITDIFRSSTNHVQNLTINNKYFLGTDFRKLLNIRSTDFTISIEDDIKITTKGYGHGVGMSQYGANEMAKIGHNYEEILYYYYKNVEILPFNV